jgi:hypothetical protein
MPSPFPGMDPYIEGLNWKNFHTSVCVALRNQLVPQVAPEFIVELEERLVIETEDDSGSFYADLGVKREPTKSESDEEAVAPVAVAETKTVTYSRIEPAREVYLRIVERETTRLVTVIEVFSPWNKRPGGHEEYLAKRDALIQAGVNLVEIDLLRRGRRIPTVESLVGGDYFAFVSRAEERPKMTLYQWTIRDPMPTVTVPLDPFQRNVALRLQEAFAKVYDEAGYEHYMDYSRSLSPSIRKTDAEWVADRIRERLKK